MGQFSTIKIYFFNNLMVSLFLLTKKDVVKIGFRFSCYGYIDDSVLIFIKLDYHVLDPLFRMYRDVVSVYLHTHTTALSVEGT